MTAQQFRRIALSLPRAAEGSHMGHPDFRVSGKIFATLSYPDEKYGVVMISSADQEKFIREMPDAFTPATGAWGRRGDTHIWLAAVDEPTLRDALNAAWRKRASK